MKAAFLALLVVGCASKERVRVEAKATEERQAAVEGKRTEAATSARTERREEGPSTIVTETRVEVAATPTAPARVVTRKRTVTRGPVKVEKTAEKAAAVKQEERKLDVRRFTSTLTAAKDKASAPAVGCQLGGLFLPLGFLFLALVGWRVYSRIRGR